MSRTIDPLRDLSEHLLRESACSSHPELRVSESIEEAELWWRTVHECAPNARREHLRWLALNDLFFLGTFLLHRWHFIGDDKAILPDEKPEEQKERHAKRNWRKATWFFNYCKAYSADPFNHIELAPRESGKSEIITYAANIQSLLKEPNETIGIFSHSRPMAKSFLRLIMRELADNTELKLLFDDVLWADPAKEAPSWGEDSGIVIKRTSNRKEASVEAWGLVDGQPTSRRFSVISFDDVISRKEISPTMILKAVEEFENALFLKAGPLRYRYCATFQEVLDPTQRLIERGYPYQHRKAFDENGRCLFTSDDEIAQLKTMLSAKVFALQILLDPEKAKGEGQLGFSHDWIEYYERVLLNLPSVNKYIIVDPAGQSGETNSYYALGVFGLAPDGRYKWLDGAYDKLNLDERTAVLKTFTIKYQPLRIFYEQRAMQADIEHIRGTMRRELWEVEIVPVGTTKLKKDERIEMLVPVFKERLMHLPREGIRYRPLHINENKEMDVVKVFLDREYLRWPMTEFKDMLDMMAWLVFPDVVRMLTWPRRYGDTANDPGHAVVDWTGGGGWMSD